MLNVLKAFLRTTYVKMRSALLWSIVRLRKTKKLLKAEIRSILFLGYDRIGDMVLSTAALRALRRAYPQAKISVLASQRNHEILE